MKVFYYHPLNIDFSSAQTIQIVRDYRSLSKLGYEVSLFGFYSSDEYRDEVIQELDGIRLYSRKNTRFNRFLLKLYFIFIMLFCSDKCLIVTRALSKSLLPVLLSKYKRRAFSVHEMHEESFDYLLKSNKSKSGFIKRISDVNLIIFTNYSQCELFEKEFGYLPKRHVVLPNGVEIEKFSKAKRKPNLVLTYLGQFNHWKNVELIFAAFSLLSEEYSMRIAGGKGDAESDAYVELMCQKYSIDRTRVDYKGYVKSTDVVSDVLSGSNVLLLPLGHNLQSEYLTSPMKLFEYMATAIPVVAVDFPSVNLLVSEKEVYLSECDAKSFAAKINEAVNADDKKIATMNQKAQQFSYKERSRSFHACVSDMLAVTK